MGTTVAMVLFVMVMWSASLDGVMCNFYRDFMVTFGGERAVISNKGAQLELSLDNSSGAGFQSNKEYLFGRFYMRLKQVPGNSAGTVTTFYLSSSGGRYDEIDFEFLGNPSGEPYTVHTNVYSEGKGEREEQFHLWFDPRMGYHTYTILWNPTPIIWMVDNKPIRVYKSVAGVPFPTAQPMRVYGTLWNADQWATQGGRVKTDWSKAPFTASYRIFGYYPCYTSSNGGCMVSSADNWWNQLSASSSSSSSGRPPMEDPVNRVLARFPPFMKPLQVCGLFWRITERMPIAPTRTVIPNPSLKTALRASRTGRALPFCIFSSPSSPAPCSSIFHLLFFDSISSIAL